MNISSIVVQTNPRNVEKLVEFIRKSELWEYHLHDKKGRIIVTIEGEGIEEEIKKLQMLQEAPLVSSAEMVFSYSGEELEKAREELSKNGKLPDWLNDPDAKISDIKYQGDLKGKY